MHIEPGPRSNKPSEQRGPTFTGVVWADPVLAVEGLVVNDVTFTPGAHTFWHRHGGGQILEVSLGFGFVGTRSGQGHLLRPGDLIHAEPGEEHWHGASPTTMLSHRAISLGATQWLEEVDEATYLAAFASLSA